MPESDASTPLARISVLMPTRGRAEQAEQFLRSLVENATHPEALEVVIYVDDDDPASHDIGCDGVALQKIIGPRLTMGGLNSACLERATGSIIGVVNDDVVVHTPGWDTRLRAVHAQFADRIYLAYPNDLFFGAAMASFPFLSRETCEALGDPFPAEYPGDFQDHHLLDIFQRLKHSGHDRICYLNDVVMEHRHHRFSKAEAEADATAQTGERMGQGDDVFLALHPYRKRINRRLRAAIAQRTLPALPAKPRITPLPAGNLGMGHQLAATFLLDGSLPWRWRWFLFVFFGKLYWIKKYKHPQPRWQYTLLQRIVNAFKPTSQASTESRKREMRP